MTDLPPFLLSGRAHRVLVVAFPPAQMLDVSGPMEVFSIANYAAQTIYGVPPPYEIVLAGPCAGPLATSAGTPLLASHGLDDDTLAADTLLVAGGAGSRMASRDPAAMERLRTLCLRVPRVGSICTGAFALAATGLLEHSRATTHWAHFDEFAQPFPAIELDRQALFVTSGRYHSSAGISAGIDFALSLIEADLGRQTALYVARELVVFLRRPGGQSQFSAQLAAEAAAPDPDRFAGLARWIAGNLDADLSVALLADRAAMSPRNFARRFTEAMGVAPGYYVEQLRIDAARRLLTGTALSIVRVAERCGFASAEAMRLAFRRHLDISPADFRARFRSALPDRTETAA
jgi:transcriptional regulator GlxA family with amidase domain